MSRAFFVLGSFLLGFMIAKISAEEPAWGLLIVPTVISLELERYMEKRK